MVEIDASVLVLFLLLPLAFIIVAMIGFGLFLRVAGTHAVEVEEVPEEEGEGGRERVERPWWGDPLLWLGAGAVMVVLGLFVAPHFLGGTFLFLPFFWVGGRRRVVRRREVDKR